MIDARLLVPAGAAWLGAVLVIVGAGLLEDPVERHGIVLVLVGSGCLVAAVLLLLAMRLSRNWRPALRSAAFGLALGA